MGFIQSAQKCKRRKDFMGGKKLLSLVMATVLLCTGLLQNTVYAKQEVTEQNITKEGNESQQGWTEDGYYGYRELEDGTLEINFIFNGIVGTELEIPGEIDGKLVTSIGECVLWGCSSLTSVIIPEGVISIGSDVFHGCNSLTSMIIPEGVTSIRSYTF